MTQKQVFSKYSMKDSLVTQEQYIQRNTKRYLRDLIDFIQIPSISTEDKGINEAVEWLTAKMHALGIHEVQVHYTDRHPVVTGVISASKQDDSMHSSRLLVYGHYDVQHDAR